MVKLTELRVGNLFEIGLPKARRKITKVIAIRQKEVLLNGNWYSFEKVIPIRITPRILLNSGFTKFGWVTESNVFECPYFKCLLENDGLQIFGDSFTNLKPLKYLHELQNLYFDLTERELEIDADNIEVSSPDAVTFEDITDSESEHPKKKEGYVLLSSNVD